MIDVALAVVTALCFAATAAGYWIGRRRRARPPAPEQPPPKEAPRKAELFPFADIKPPPPKKKDEPDLVIGFDEDEDAPVSTRIGARDEDEIQPAIEKIVYDGGADVPSSERAARFRVEATALTDSGRRRKRNEDRFLSIPEENVFVVADGMGGHRGGDLASQVAIEEIALAFATKSFEGAVHEDVPVAASELARAVQMANAGIRRMVVRKPEMHGMGTTIVAALFVPEDDRLYIAHVGDSRCYRFRNDRLTLLTNDHTLAELGGADTGALSRAVGIWSTVTIDLLLTKPKVGDVYLLCSDGLSKMISDETILSVLRTDEPPAASVERLVSVANAHGGRDNITVLLVHVMENIG